MRNRVVRKESSEEDENNSESGCEVRNRAVKRTRTTVRVAVRGGTEQ